MADELLDRLRAIDASATAGTARVLYATARVALSDHGDDETHIECRFENGQKYAPIVVSDGHEALAFWICDSFRVRNSLPALIALLAAADEVRIAFPVEYRTRFAAALNAYDAARAAYAAQIGEGRNG